MLKVFLKDSALYTISNILTKGIGFLMLPIYTRFFQPNQFGLLDLLLITGQILSLFVGLEIHQAVARFFPEASTDEEKKRVVSSGFWFVFIATLLVFVPAISLTPLLKDKVLEDNMTIEIVCWALASYGFNFIYYYMSSQLRWQMKSKQSLFVSVLYSGFAAFLTYVFLAHFGEGLEAVFIAQSIAAFIGALASWIFSRKYYTWSIQRSLVHDMLQFSIPLVFTTITVYALLYMDRFLINSLLGQEDLGYYGLAYRLASVVSLITLGVQTALTPLIYNNYKSDETPRQLARLFHYFLIGSLIFIAGLSLGSPLIVQLMASASYAPASALIPWVAATMLLTGVTNFTPGLFIAKKTQIIFYINFVSMILNLLLGYALIKILGLLGAVCATTICSLIYFLMYYVYGQKYYFIPFFWTKLKR